MLYDSLTVQEVVDTESSAEFLKEATKLATSRELENIAQRLEMKRGMFAELLAPERLASLTEDEFVLLLDHVFSIRRKARRLLRLISVESFRQRTQELLYGEEDVGDRFERFVTLFEGSLDERRSINLASELLHFHDPDKHWLWTNWIWDPETGSGALPMVVQEGIVIEGKSSAERYRNVGAALRLVNEVGHAQNISGNTMGMLGTNLLLACVHAVYMYTVFRLKLSDEFNRILPELPELVERVLGVRGLEVVASG
ncbi:MAG: hypothetical protein QGE96_04390 [Candidatus Poseidoniia archaeon]|jgi:hypothetical protein|nr:hypothetical protein [Candidatus Poseidoniia archaeon]MDP7256195.1 hypothetical protein [Candidatus Poseidoniia archaeon]|tara:strand:- start:763 stop:1530 length:768 start_codon:yes stop_codon:yes gene_type:complete